MDSNEDPEERSYIIGILAETISIITAVSDNGVLGITRESASGSILESDGVNMTIPQLLIFLSDYPVSVLLFLAVETVNPERKASVSPIISTNMGPSLMYVLSRPGPCTVTGCML